MTHKLLLLGNNRMIMDEFFHITGDYFEIQTCSMHVEDIESHIKYYEPDAYVYCLGQENKSNFITIQSLRIKAKYAGIPLIIIGSADDVDECMSTIADVVNLKLVKPITANAIREEVYTFLKDWKIGLLKKDEPASAPATAPVQPVKSDAPEDPSAKQWATYVKRRKSDLAPGEKFTILVVDDDARMLKTIKLFLDDEYKVAMANNGNVALKYLLNKTCDLILLDYEMPGLSGPEVLTELRDDPDTADIPVVFLTGAAEKEKITLALSMKPQGYLLKPVDRTQLIDKLAELLN